MVVASGSLLRLFQDGKPRSRAEIVRETGWARATVTQRLQVLIDQHWVVGSDRYSSTGGRPAGAFVLNRARGVLLVADIGSSHTRVGIADLYGTLLAARDYDIDVAEGPQRVLGRLASEYSELLEQIRVARRTVLAIGVGVPGPVEFATGRVIRPPTMQGWDGCQVPDYLRGEFDVPIAVDKDANIMALGEYRAIESKPDCMLMVKVGMGVGASIVFQGSVFRGSRGMAADLGHMPHGEGPLCRCGQLGCAEASAGAWAISRRLREVGRVAAHTSADVVELANQLDPAAISLLRDAGRRIGDVAADAVGIVNPSLIVVGGDLAEAGDPLLAGIRERVYQRSHPLATEHLTIAASRLGREAGLVGAANLATDTALANEEKAAR